MVERQMGKVARQSGRRRECCKGEAVFTIRRLFVLLLFYDNCLLKASNIVSIIDNVI